MECGLRVSAFLRVSVGAHVHAASARLAVIAQCLRKRRGVGGVTNAVTSGEFNCEHTVGLIIRPFPAKGKHLGLRISQLMASLLCSF